MFEETLYDGRPRFDPLPEHFAASPPPAQQDEQIQRLRAAAYPQPDPQSETAATDTAAAVMEAALKMGRIGWPDDDSAIGNLCKAVRAHDAAKGGRS